ncbi:hypothetical protein [Paenibacillus luteus]|uniref:hypothetical protein n=1 Tax=Paenibacillus luteus TaxID=2545753 RepID=UPI0011434E2E|nr:hypothetical protein [Paenibacillus luteus]
MEINSGAEIREALYKGFPSVVIESDSVRLEIVPELGAKIVSLMYKPTGKEWLLDSGTRKLESVAQASSFTDADMSGWDECFPTIDPCVIGQGIKLPDHGEVWSLPWASELEGNTIACSVKGVALPYRFTRKIMLLPSGTIRLAYETVNEGKEAFPFLWAAHPQFAITEPTEILVPQAMHKLLCVYGGKQLTLGEEYDLAEHKVMQPDVTGDGIKFYYPGVIPEGWSGLFGQASGNYLMISYPVAQVPYFGLWLDKGVCNDRAVCALEPGIGYYDSLARAAGNGTAKLLEPAERYAWHIDLMLGQGSLEDVMS